MAEERIVFTIYTENPCADCGNPYKPNCGNGEHPACKHKKNYTEGMTRAEAIEKIATGYCGGICEKCTDGPKGSEHCIKWLEFRGTMEKAEAALNALLGE